MKKRYKLFLQVLIGISLAAAFSAATIAQSEEIGNEAKNPLSVSDMEARLKSLLEEREKLTVELQLMEEEINLSERSLSNLNRLINRFAESIEALKIQMQLESEMNKMKRNKPGHSGKINQSIKHSIDGES